MPKQNRKFGNWGESLAEDFLRKRNYEILERNFQKQCGEIDIIAKRENILHFVEVKTRTISSVEKFGLPEEAVSRIKQQKIIQTAFSYLYANNYPGNTDWQIDVISIIRSNEKGTVQIRLINNAFDGSQF